MKEISSTIKMRTGSLSKVINKVMQFSNLNNNDSSNLENTNKGKVSNSQNNQKEAKKKKLAKALKSNIARRKNSFSD